MTTIITHADASAAILAACDAGTLVQGTWHGRAADGREIACLLGAIHPSVNSPADCNGDLMPMWLAELTPALFDGLPAEAVVPMARRYGLAVARWHALSPDAWNSVLRDFLIRIIDDAVDAARPACEGKPYWQQVSDVYAQCRAAVQSGDEAAARAARAAADAVARVAADAAARAARVARVAAEAVASAAASAAAGAAEVAARVASRAAAGAAAAARLAGAAASLRMFTFLLDRIEFYLCERFGEGVEI